MRISTTLMFRTGLETINAQQSQLLHLYQQVGTGRRMVTPSDDPLAASRAINLGQTEAQNTRFAANRDIAKQNLGMEDDVLKTVTAALVDVRTRLVEAGNGSYSDKDRANLAGVLRASYELLLNQANAKDGNGQYLFSGASGNATPYSVAAGETVAEINPDLIDGDRKIQVDQTRQISSGDMADKVFLNLFESLDAAILVLESDTEGDPVAAEALRTQLATTGSDMEAVYDNVLTVRASVGARMVEIDALDSNGDLRNLNYRKELSNLEDADYYEATSMLTLRQAALDAAAMAFQRIQSTSLFNKQ